MIHLQELYRLGVDVYTQGTIKSGRKITAYYYKLWDGITPDKLAEVQQAFPAAHTARTRAQYAPELVGNVLIIPSKAQIMRQHKEMNRQRIATKSAGNNTWGSVLGLTNKGERA